MPAWVKMKLTEGVLKATIVSRTACRTLPVCSQISSDADSDLSVMSAYLQTARPPLRDMRSKWKWFQCSGL